MTIETRDCPNCGISCTGKVEELGNCKDQCCECGQHAINEFQPREDKNEDF